MAYKPPYNLTSAMFTMAGEIILLIGQIQGYLLLTGNLKLRRQNKIKTIMSSLAIEGNTLNEDQISDIIDGKPVLGPPREILEVKNALAVYDLIAKFGRKDYLQFHKNLSPATASRDLKRAVNENILEKEGEIRNSIYNFR